MTRTRARPTAGHRASRRAMRPALSHKGMPNRSTIVRRFSRLNRIDPRLSAQQDEEV